MVTGTDQLQALPARPKRDVGRAVISFEAEFDRLFHDRFASLFTYLVRMTGDGDLASDLAQDAFVRLYQRGSFPEDAVAWLVTVAHNRLRDHQRSLGRRLRLLVTAREAVPVPTPLPGAEAEVEGGERRGRVRAILASLTERQGQVLLLHHAGYSYQEISGVLGVAVTGVGTLLRRASVAFRQAYQEAYGAPD